jgi:hypothetical protein
VLPGKRGTPDGSAAAFSPVAQRINQLFWLTNFAVTNDAFARGIAHQRRKHQPTSPGPAPRSAPYPVEYERPFAMF